MIKVIIANFHACDDLVRFVIRMWMNFRRLSALADLVWWRIKKGNREGS